VGVGLGGIVWVGVGVKVGGSGGFWLQEKLIQSSQTPAGQSGLPGQSLLLEQAGQQIGVGVGVGKRGVVGVGVEVGVGVGSIIQVKFSQNSQTPPEQFGQRQSV